MREHAGRRARFSFRAAPVPAILLFQSYIYLLKPSRASPTHLSGLRVIARDRRDGKVSASFPSRSRERNVIYALTQVISRRGKNTFPADNRTDIRLCLDSSRRSILPSQLLINLSGTLLLSCLVLPGSSSLIAS